MHASSLENMRQFVGDYLSSYNDRTIKILDVGSSDVNGSYASIFSKPNWSYFGADLEPGPNVDIVLKDIYRWGEFKNGEFDVVISGQTFEHIEYIWKTISEIKRVLRPGGLCCIIVPSTGPEHKFPKDCWRIFPDGMNALATYAGLEILSIKTHWEDGDYTDDSNTWHDTVLIAKRPEINKEKAEIRHVSSGEQLLQPEYCYQFVPRLFFNDSWSGHLPFANWLTKELEPGIIVELGTYHGESYFTFCQSVQENNLNTICYAVDNWQGDEHSKFYSGQVFDGVKKHNDSNYSQFSYLLRMDFDDAVRQFDDETIDLLHIDGYHTLEVVNHDFTTWLPKVKPGGIILFHDIAARFSDFGVWKFWEEIREKSEETFEFFHSWGRGVWRKPGGKNISSTALMELFTKNGTISEARTRNTFVLSATNVSLRSRLNIEIEKYNTLKSRYDQLLADHRKVMNSYTWRIARRLRLIFRNFPGNKCCFKFIIWGIEIFSKWKKNHE